LSASGLIYLRKFSLNRFAHDALHCRRPGSGLRSAQNQRPLKAGSLQGRDLECRLLLSRQRFEAQDPDGLPVENMGLLFGGVRCVNPCLTKFFREIFTHDLTAIFLRLQRHVNPFLTTCPISPHLSHIAALTLVQLWHTGDTII
jgi:hypothetical protein